MSELALPPSRRRPDVDLMTFADEASSVRRIAQVLVQTDFVPAAYRGKPDEATAAILYGRELAIGPMVSLQTIDVIKGRPSLSAHLMKGMAQAAGVIFENPEQSQERVVMRAQRPPHQAWTYSTWDLARARKADLLKKEMWQKYPGSMLLARCTAELCRLVAADVLMGMAYSSEELADMDAPDVSAPAEKTKTVRRKATYEAPGDITWPEPAPLPAPETLAITAEEAEADAVAIEDTVVNEAPDVVEEAEPDYPDSYSPVDDEGRVHPETPAPKPDAVQANTRAALMAGFNDMGIRDRSKRLGIVSQILGRQVLSVNQLNEAEGRKVVDALHKGEWPVVAEIPK